MHGRGPCCHRARRALPGRPRPPQCGGYPAIRVRRCWASASAADRSVRVRADQQQAEKDPGWAQLYGGREATPPVTTQAPGWTLTSFSPARNRHPIETSRCNARPGRHSPSPWWRCQLHPTPLRIAQAPQQDPHQAVHCGGDPRGDGQGLDASMGPSYHGSCDFALIPDPRHGHDGAARPQAADTLVMVCRYAPISPVEGTETG